MITEHFGMDETPSDKVDNSGLIENSGLVTMDYEVANDAMVDDDVLTQLEDVWLVKTKTEQVDEVGKNITFYGKPRESFQEERGAHGRDDVRLRPIGTQLANGNSSVVATSYSYEVYDTVD